MFKNIVFSLCILLAGFTQLSYAHPGGHGPIKQQQAIMLAAEVASQFVDFDPGLGFGKLAASWKEIPQQDQRLHVNGEGYYIVSIHNRKVVKTLYVLMSNEGEVYDANFTGKFQGLK